MSEYSPAKTGKYRRIFPNFKNCARSEKDLKDNKHNSLHLEREYLTIILRNGAEYRLILSRRGRNQTIFREIEHDNCFIIQQIDNKTARNIFKSFCRQFFTSLFLPTYEATYIAGYLLPTDDRYREHHDHIWIVLQFVE